VEVIAAVREQAPQIPIFAMKSPGGGAAKPPCFDSRMVALEKPIQSAALLDAIKRLVTNGSTPPN
jgi:hypothetical protein